MLKRDLWLPTVRRRETQEQSGSAALFTTSGRTNRNALGRLHREQVELISLTRRTSITRPPLDVRADENITLGLLQRPSGEIPRLLFSASYYHVCVHMQQRGTKGLKQRENTLRLPSTAGRTGVT